MPAHAKTTDLQIIQAAHRLVEQHGRDGFSMKEVAAEVGIRAPSLYGRFKDRESLLSAVELQVWADLAALLGDKIIASDPEETLLAQARAIRGFAASHPNLYSLFFDIRFPPTDAGNSARGAALAQMISPLAALVGGDGAFAAARVIVAYLHGFISIELADGFRLGGGVDAAFENGLRVFLRGLMHSKEFDDEA